MPSLVETQASVRKLQQRRARAEGQEEQLLKDLKGLGYKTQKAAQKDLVQIDKEITKKTGKLDRLLDKFHEKFGEYL